MAERGGGRGRVVVSRMLGFGSPLALAVWYGLRLALLTAAGERCGAITDSKPVYLK